MIELDHQGGTLLGLNIRERAETTVTLPEQFELVAFTDGLVEEPGLAYDDGVARLLAAVRDLPDRLSGQQRAQRLVADIIGVPTVREADGLAMSSRNAYLTEQERADAAKLPRAMREAVAAIGAGEHDHLVPLAGHIDARERMNQAGVPNVLIVVPYSDHGYDAAWGSLGSQITQHVAAEFLEKYAPAHAGPEK